MLAVVSLAIAFVVPMGLIGGPFAVVMARSSLENIKSSNGTVGGRRSALAGYALGLVVTVLLVLFGLLVLGVFGTVSLNTNHLL